jgi:hypothetical protein
MLLIPLAKGISSIFVLLEKTFLIYKKYHKMSKISNTKYNKIKKRRNYIMFNVQPIEWIGYAASITVVISLTMTAIVKLRIINSIGCLLFVVYGLYVKAYPVALANAVIVLINIHNLYKLRSSNR